MKVLLSLVFESYVKVLPPNAWWEFCHVQPEVKRKETHNCILEAISSFDSPSYIS